jgi:hypothetical protein
MAKATRVLSTPPTNTSANNPPDQPMTPDDELGTAWWNSLTKQERAKWSDVYGNTGRAVDAWPAFKRGSKDQSPPVDQARRRFITIAAGASVARIGTLAVVAMPAVLNSAASAIDPAFALIAAHRAAEIAHCKVIDAQAAAEIKYGIRSDEAWEAADRSGDMCDEVNAICWKLATTLAGVAAVLRFANEVEDAGLEWPETDTIGSEGWHYQLRVTMAAAAVEALIKAQGRKAVRS